jgi:hypothetical protein
MPARATACWTRVLIEPGLRPVVPTRLDLVTLRKTGPSLRRAGSSQSSRARTGHRPGSPARGRAASSAWSPWGLVLQRGRPTAERIGGSVPSRVQVLDGFRPGEALGEQQLGRPPPVAATVVGPAEDGGAPATKRARGQTSS